MCSRIVYVCEPNEPVWHVVYIYRGPMAGVYGGVWWRRTEGGRHHGREEEVGGNLTRTSCIV